MKYLLIFLIWTIGISFDNIALSGQPSSAILLNHKWETIMGNQLQFTTDSILFDEMKCDITTGRTSTLTDSSFICTTNGTGDTIVYFEYKVNNDSLMMTFIPTWFKVDKYGSLNCSFSTYSNCRFCHLVNRNVTFYSKSYLKRTNKQFQLAYIESKPSDQIYYKLLADGSFIFSTKNKAISYQNYRKRSAKGTYRSFNGVYKGKLHPKSMDSLKTVLNSMRGLKGYLHHSYHQTNNSISISGKHSTFHITRNSLDILIKTAITFLPKEMYFIGLYGNLEPEPVIIYEKSNVLLPDFYGKNFYHGLYAVSGKVSFVKELKTKDTTLYLYEIKDYNFPSKSDTTIEKGHPIAFISKFRLNSVDLVLLYNKKRVYYRRFLGQRKRVVYNLIADTLNNKHHYIYEYIDESRGHKRKIAKLPIRNKKNANYPQINTKIARALRRLKK